MKKVTYIKNAVTAVLLVAAMALPTTAMAAQAPAAPNTPAVTTAATITQAEKQELDDACRKLETLEAELNRLLEENLFDKLAQVEDQMAVLRVRVLELAEKESPSVVPDDSEDLAAFVANIKELKLSDADKQALRDACAKLSELQKAAARGEKVDSQMAALEAQIAALEEKAFPTIGDSMSYEDYVKPLELTDAEKAELIAAYKAENETKINALELKAAVNSMAKLTGGESQAYADAARQLSQMGDEMVRLILSNGNGKQLDQLAEKMGALYDRMTELRAAK